jgi:hypothetical protein
MSSFDPAQALEQRRGGVIEERRCALTCLVHPRRLGLGEVIELRGRSVVPCGIRDVVGQNGHVGAHLLERLERHDRQHVLGGHQRDVIHARGQFAHDPVDDDHGSEHRAHLEKPDRLTRNHGCRVAPVRKGIHVDGPALGGAESVQFAQGHQRIAEVLRVLDHIVGNTDRKVGGVKQKIEWKRKFRILALRGREVESGLNEAAHGAAVLVGGRRYRLGVGSRNQEQRQRCNEHSFIHPSDPLRDCSGRAVAHSRRLPTGPHVHPELW